MPQIMTVLGGIEPGQLGCTSMHEHVLADGTVYMKLVEGKLREQIPVKPDDRLTLENFAFHQRNYPLTTDNVRQVDVDWMAEEVRDFKESGGQAIVDVSVPGLRADVLGLRQISERTGVHLITATGLYTEVSWPERFRNLTRDEYAAFMLDEIEHGIDGTGVRPGLIKVAISELTAQQESFLRAAGRVANETGLSVTVHPGLEGIGNDGRRIAKILKEEGVDLRRVVICHADEFFMPTGDFRRLILNPELWALTIDYHKELLDQGVNLSIESFGHQWALEVLHHVRETDWQRLGGLIALIKQGYSPQMVLGTDNFTKIQTRRGGGDGFARLTRFVIPTLREVGVSDFDIRQMMVENPARLLAY